MVTRSAWHNEAPFSAHRPDTKFAGKPTVLSARHPAYWLAGRQV